MMHAQLIVRKIIGEASHNGAPTDCDEDFIKSGYLDSLSIVRFVLMIEEAFAITIDVEDIDTPDFRSVNGIVRIIESKRNEV
jgi:acyl carrier protein